MENSMIKLFLTFVLAAGVFAMSPTQCVTPSVTAAPDPVAVGSPVTIDQLLTNSCNGNGKVTFWTNVSGQCTEGLTLEFQRNISVPSGGSLSFSDQYTPPCAGTYTVTTTVQTGAQNFVSATTTFVAQ
jgi:hypothetical protein